MSDPQSSSRSTGTDLGSPELPGHERPALNSIGLSFKVSMTIDDHTLYILGESHYV